MFQVLQDGHQRQTPGRETWLATGGEQMTKVFVVVERTKFIAQLHHHASLGEGGASGMEGGFRNWADHCRFEGHRS
jgi:hypothetical protein